MTSEAGETGTEGWRTGTGEGDEAGETADPSTETRPSAPAAVASSAGEGLGWRGWVLVGWLVVTMVVVPWSLVFLPELQGFVESLGLGLRDAYLVLPMVPALGLGLLAVWAAVRSRQSD